MPNSINFFGNPFQESVYLLKWRFFDQRSLKLLPRLFKSFSLLVCHFFTASICYAKTLISAKWYSVLLVNQFKSPCPTGSKTSRFSHFNGSTSNTITASSLISSKEKYARDKKREHRNQTIIIPITYFISASLPPAAPAQPSRRL